MRLSLFLLIMSIFQVQAISVYAQKTQLSLDFRSTSIEKILSEIEGQSEYYFLYNKNLVDVKRKVDIQVKDQQIGVILDQLFGGTDVNYRIFNRQIVLSVGENPISGVSAQVRTVTGKVTNEAGEPIPGVTVVVKGTTMGTITDVDGKYSLKDVQGDGTLLFSFVGMRNQEVTVSGKHVIDIVLEEETIGLNEVVAIGYGVQKKATLTGAIGTIKAEEMLQRPVANTTELLQGQVAGLVTQQSSGLPGADGTTLSIRGFGNNPLIIVDGVYSSLAQVDPNDIESVSVLKDAAAAIYGARAGNGVILVTTKRGNEKASQVTYHGSVSVTQPTFLAKQVNAREYAEMLYEAGVNPSDYGPRHIHYDPETKALTSLVDGSNYEGYNWAKAMYRNWTPQHQHNLSARGGNDKIKYFVSAGFTDQESNFKSGDYDFQRYNIRSNIDAEITKNLAVAVDFSYYSTLLDKANFDVSDVFNLVNSSRPFYPYVHEADPSKAAYSGGTRTPYYKTFREYSGFIENQENLLRGTLELRYSFPMIKGLVAKARLSYEDVFSWDKNVSKPFDVWDYDQLKAKNGEDPWSKRGTEGFNTMYVYADRFHKLLPLFSLEYEKTLGDHYIKGMVASETWTTTMKTLRGDRKDILSFEAPFLNFASQEGKDNSETLTEKARASFIGRINYEYAGKYLMEVAMRADASAEYAPEGRWGYYPSVSAGWRISEESFLRDNFSALDNLKLRASYGILGFDQVSSFDYLTGYTITGGYYIFGNTPAPVINSAGLANPGITWETMKISNIGLDGTFWDGKLGFVIDAFYRLREDILAEPKTQVPTTFGASLPKTNLNKQDNRGFEITLTHMNKIGDFSYDISPMFSWTRGKFVDWDEASTPPSNLTTEEDKEFWRNRNLREGQWDDRQWGYLSDGFFMSQQEIDEYPINQDQNQNPNLTVKVGDLKYKDLNGDNYIDWRDETVIGKSGLPKIMYSLNMGAAYKGISIRMLWQGASDYAVTFSERAAFPFQSEGIPLAEHYKYRAITAADSEGKLYITNPDDFKLPPASIIGRTPNNAKASDFWTFDARFLRLKNLNISYTLPQKLIVRSGVSQCTVYMSGTNLFTISNLGIWKKSFDPEITGQDNRDYPPVKTLTFGLRLTI
jgi:TonB-linked SusC/RagA family outer membrane protein